MPLVKIDGARMERNPHPSFSLRKSDEPYFDQLAEGQLRVLKLRHHEKMSYEEMVADTGWKLNTIRTRIHRGRQKILELRAADERAAETMQEPIMPARAM